MCAKPNVSRHIVTDTVLCQLQIQPERAALSQNLIFTLTKLSNPALERCGENIQPLTQAVLMTYADTLNP